MFKDKFKLTAEQSLFLAKKKWDENVYCGMKMENRVVTFPQTKTILSGVNVPDVQLDDIQAILNMRDAWKYLINTIDEPITFNYWCKLNELIARNEALEWGKLRTGSVGISGTDYEPPIPRREKVTEELYSIILSDKSATEKALEAFVWGVRGQFFWDGNKRTSLTLANKILVMAGAGILTITDSCMTEFNALLIDYYNTGESETLKTFLYEKAIQGIIIKKESLKRYNPHSYAVSIEHLFNLPYQSAYEIEENPLGYLKNILDDLYEQSDEKSKLIDKFDDKYNKYKHTHLRDWDEVDASQMLKDLRQIKSK